MSLEVFSVPTIHPFLQRNRPVKVSVWRALAVVVVATNATGFSYRDALQINQLAVC